MTVPFSKSITEFLEDQGFQHIAARDELPCTPGVYVVFRCPDIVFNLNRAECLYVGQSVSLRTRLSNTHAVWQHIGEHYRTYCIYYKSLASTPSKNLRKELMFLESLTIGVLRPSLNAGTPSRPPYKGYRAVLYICENPPTPGYLELHAIEAELWQKGVLVKRFEPEHIDHIGQFPLVPDEEILRDKKAEILRTFSKFANQKIKDFSEIIKVDSSECPLIDRCGYWNNATKANLIDHSSSESY